MILSSAFESLIQIDRDILLWVNGHHAPFWDGFMYLYSEKFTWIPFYLSLIYVLIRNFTLKYILIILMASVVIVSVSDMVSAKLIRSWVDRYRPTHDEELSSLVHVVFGKRGGHWSFPSSHSANAWGSAVYMMLVFRRYWLSVVMVAWASLMCYSRMYLGMHFLGDLLAGAVIGVLTSLLVWWIFRKWTSLHRAARFKHLSVPVIVWLVSLLGFSLLSAFNVRLFV